MKQIILRSTVLEFTSLVNDGFMEENGQAPFSQENEKSEHRHMKQIILEVPQEI